VIYSRRISVKTLRFLQPLVLLLTLCFASGISAQSTTGTISGRVTDAQNLPLPGVTVTVESPALQGTRSTVTSENGDYIISLLPSGAYTVAFEISGFEGQRRSVNVAPTQTVPVDATLGVGRLTEVVQVTGRAADVLTQTAQVATNFSQELISKLPTNRDINAVLLMAPSAHPTGPSGNWSIAGSMSFENLFMINGVTVNENLRGQANTLFIEDAIQETTVATAGISAEYGRFGGGVVNMITKSGGNQFSGSFRDTLHNDDWRALVPQRQGDTFANDTKVDDVVPQYEYTFGGPILRDRVWFFTAGRLQKRASARQLVQTNIPYIFTQDSKRFEFNSTYSPSSKHRVQGTYIREDLKELNNTFDFAISMDQRSLSDRETPQDLTTFSYNGVLTSNFFVEARVSKRNFTFVGSGAKSTDIIEGTLLLDRQRGNLRYWADTFCGICTQEERDNENVFVKGNYFLSNRGIGSHSLVVGYDNFNDVRKANNRQSGSDYRILGTTTIIQGTEVWPVFLGDGSTIIQWNPIPILSLGSDFRTHGVFINDSWRVTDRLTANLGLRYDKNDGSNQEGELVVKDSLFSPRLGVVFDPTGGGDWSVTASVSRYAASVVNSVADSSSKAGNPQTWQYLYRGPDINGGGVPSIATPDAIRTVFNWFQATGGCAPRDDSCRPNIPTNGAPTLPGVSLFIGDGLITPNNWEYALGLNRQFGGRAAIRVDYIFRDYKDFYTNDTNLSTGRVTNELGQSFDRIFVVNTNDLKRRYQGLTTQGTYRMGSRTDIGVLYTLSRAWGNLEGETVQNGATTFGALLNSPTQPASGPFQYPEYKQESWNYPEGDLAIDQRHRARLWINYGVPRVEGLTLSLLQNLESGVPYTAATASGVDPRPYVTNPGYVTPPTGSQTIYYFTARDGFRLEGQKRTDLAANYTYDLNLGTRRLSLFVQGQVVNLFNQFQLCGCGANVFLNGGAAQSRFVDQAVRTAVTNAATYRPFNPFTETPVEGVHWDLSPAFGKATSRFAYTSPRMFRMTFGVRF
jgi:outer membrane receptor for ferrienterochelin and colicin